jgi:phosphatidate phosphatase APP1
MNIIHYVEDYLDKFKNLALGSEKTTAQQIDIVPYRTYGTPDWILCRGRVLLGNKIAMKQKDGYWRNLVNTYRRFESDEIPGAHLEITYADSTFELHNDQEGFYHFATALHNPTPLPHPAEWQTYDIQLLSINNQAVSPMPTDTGHILIPPPSATYGIISDIDDTVIYTSVVSKTKMLYYTFFKNAYSRLAFPGVAALYWALHRGLNNKAHNPIFYVSNGPWNLYDMLSDFMDINNLPKGPILLRDFGTRNDNDQILSYQDHKYNEIVNILRTYPNMPFILIGDSGEKDADIYRRVAHLFPNRIKAIYIRNVQDHSRAERIKQLIEREDHIDIQLIDDSQAIAQHAFQNNHISLEGLNAVKGSMYNRSSNFIIDHLMSDDDI